MVEGLYYLCSGGVDYPDFFSGLLIKGFRNPIIFKSILNTIASHFVDGCGVDS